MNRYRPKPHEEPATGHPPDPNYQYWYPTRFSDALEYHPQLAQALCGTLTDSWEPYSDPAQVTR